MTKDKPNGPRISRRPRPETALRVTAAEVARERESGRLLIEQGIEQLREANAKVVRGHDLAAGLRASGEQNWRNAPAMRDESEVLARAWGARPRFTNSSRTRPRARADGGAFVATRGHEVFGRRAPRRRAATPDRCRRRWSRPLPACRARRTTFCRFAPWCAGRPAGDLSRPVRRAPPLRCRERPRRSRSRPATSASALAVEHRVYVTATSTAPNRAGGGGQRRSSTRCARGDAAIVVGSGTNGEVNGRDRHHRPRRGGRAARDRTSPAPARWSARAAAPGDRRGGRSPSAAVTAAAASRS
jgi:hypothetical protein